MNDHLKAFRKGWLTGLEQSAADLAACFRCARAAFWFVVWVMFFFWVIRRLGWMP